MKIKALTARLKLAVIVVNQVADAINYPGFTYGRFVLVRFVWKKTNSYICTLS